MPAQPDCFSAHGGLTSREVKSTSSFQFHCHSAIDCFTDCCRELDLALSPYDVIRLKQALGLSSLEFMERHAIVEFTARDLAPKVYLAMIDDGRSSCPFVSPAGCQVYPHRPGACRIYPVGRGVSFDASGAKKEHFILIQEEHCCGFREQHSQTICEWQNGQQTEGYDLFSDALLPLLLNDNGRPRPRMTEDQATLFIETLYNLEQFKERLIHGSTDSSAIPTDEPALLTLAIDWLQQEWHRSR